MSLLDLKIIQARHLPFLAKKSTPATAASAPKSTAVVPCDTISPFVQVIYIDDNNQEQKVQTSVLPPLQRGSKPKWHEEVFTKLKKHDSVKYLTVQVWNKDVWEGDCLLGEGVISVDDGAVLQGIVKDMWIPLSLEQNPNQQQKSDVIIISNTKNKSNNQNENDEQDLNNNHPTNNNNGMLRVKLLPLNFGLELDDLDDDQIHQLTGGTGVDTITSTASTSVNTSARSDAVTDSARNHNKDGGSARLEMETSNHDFVKDPFAPHRRASTSVHNNNNSISPKSKNERKYETSASDQNIGDPAEDYFASSSQNNNQQQQQQNQDKQIQKTREIPPPKFSRDVAAIKIQSLQRRRQSRSKSQERVQEKHEREEREDEQKRNQEQEQAALTIQTAQRQRHSREISQERARNKKSCNSESQQQEKELAAIKIQSLARRNHAKIVVDAKKKTVQQQQQQQQQPQKDAAIKKDLEKQSQQRERERLEQEREVDEQLKKNIEKNQAAATAEKMKNENIAALKIQSLQRQRQARQAVQRKREEKHKMELRQEEIRQEREQQRAATRIQSLQRQRQAKAVFEQKKTAKAHREKEVREQTAAIKIQSLQRQRQARAYVDEKRKNQKEKEEAQKISAPTQDQSTVKIRRRPSDRTSDEVHHVSVPTTTATTTTTTTTTTSTNSQNASAVGPNEKPTKRGSDHQDDRKEVTAKQQSSPNRQPHLGLIQSLQHSSNNYNSNNHDTYHHLLLLQDAKNSTHHPHLLFLLQQSKSKNAVEDCPHLVLLDETQDYTQHHPHLLLLLHDLPHDIENPRLRLLLKDLQQTNGDHHKPHLRLLLQNIQNDNNHCDNPHLQLLLHDLEQNNNNPHLDLLLQDIHRNSGNPHLQLLLQDLHNSSSKNASSNDTSKLSLGKERFSQDSKNSSYTSIITEKNENPKVVPVSNKNNNKNSASDPKPKQQEETIITVKPAESSSSSNILAEEPKIGKDESNDKNSTSNKKDIEKEKMKSATSTKDNSMSESSNKSSSKSEPASISRPQDSQRKIQPASDPVVLAVSTEEDEKNQVVLARHSDSHLEQEKAPKPIENNSHQQQDQHQTNGIHNHHHDQQMEETFLLAISTGGDEHGETHVVLARSSTSQQEQEKIPKLVENNDNNNVVTTQQTPSSAVKKKQGTHHHGRHHLPQQQKNIQQDEVENHQDPANTPSSFKNNNNNNKNKKSNKIEPEKVPSSTRNQEQKTNNAPAKQGGDDDREKTATTSKEQQEVDDDDPSLPPRSDKTAIDHLKLIVKLCKEGGSIAHDPKAICKALNRHFRCAIRHWFYAEWEKSKERGISDFDDDDDEQEDGGIKKKQILHEIDMQFITKYPFSRKCPVATCLSALVRKEFTAITKHREENILGHLLLERNPVAVTTLIRFIYDHQAANVASTLCGLTLRKFMLLQRDEECLILLQSIPHFSNGDADDETEKRQVVAEEGGAVAKENNRQRDPNSPEAIHARKQHEQRASVAHLATAPIDTIHGDTLLHGFCRRRRPRANLIERYLRHVLLNDSNTNKNTNKKDEQPRVVAKETETGTGSPRIVTTNRSPQPSSSASPKSNTNTANPHPFDINGKNINGLTPLHLVVVSSIGVEGRSAFNLLVEFGASIYLRGPDGRDLMDMCTNGFIRDVLEEKLAKENELWKQQQQQQAASSSATNASNSNNNSNLPSVLRRSAQTKAVQLQEHADVRIRSKIDEYPDILNLPRVLFSPGGIKRKNDRIELDDDYCEKDDDDDEEEEEDDRVRTTTTKKKRSKKPNPVDVSAVSDRLYVNPQKQRSDFTAHWISEADKRREEYIHSKYPPGHAPVKNVSADRLVKLVSHLHDDACAAKQRTMQRLVDEQNDDDATNRRGVGVRLTVEEQQAMGDRLCNVSMSRKAENLDRVSAEMYPVSKTGGNTSPLSKEKVVALGKRLHDDCRVQANDEMKKLFDKYVPAQKKVCITEEEQAAAVARLSPPKTRPVPRQV